MIQTTQVAPALFLRAQATASALARVRLPNDFEDATRKFNTLVKSSATLPTNAESAAVAISKKSGRELVDSVMEKSHKDLFNRCDNVRDQAKLTILREKGAQAGFDNNSFGRILPGESNRTEPDMPKREWTMMIKLKLVQSEINLLIPPEIPRHELGNCTRRKLSGNREHCNKPRDPNLNHDMHCKPALQSHHTAGTITCKDVVEQCGIPVSLHASIPDSAPDEIGRGLRRGDLSVMLFHPDGNIRTNIIDFSLRSYERKQWVEQGLYNQMISHLSSAEKSKNEKYRDLCQNAGMDFTPFIMSTLGVFGKSARAFIQELGAHMAANKFVHPSYACQRIAAYLQIKIMKKFCGDLCDTVDAIKRNFRLRQEAGHA
jgi:hypothetical protein